MSKTLHQIEAELEALRTEARTTARRLKADGYHTPDGIDATFARYQNKGEWTTKVEELGAAAYAAIDSATSKRDALKSQMTTPTGTTEERLLAEQRHNRRARRIEAAISSGAGALVDLIVDADPMDLPLVYEEAVDFYAVKGGEAGKAGLAMLDHALQQRNPDYRAAVSTAGRAESTRHLIDEKLKFVQAAVTDPNAADPTPGGMATVSVSAAGDDVAGLAA